MAHTGTSAGNTWHTEFLIVITGKYYKESIVHQRLIQPPIPPLHLTFIAIMMYPSVFDSDFTFLSYLSGRY
jgi:hypothetical protein